jgi:hypothetical protein
MEGKPGKAKTKGRRGRKIRKVLLYHPLVVTRRRGMTQLESLKKIDNVISVADRMIYEKKKNYPVRLEFLLSIISYMFDRLIK